MPIRKITSPSEAPLSVDDYTAQNDLIEALLLAAQGAQRIVGSNVAKGAIFYVGGTTYKADANTAITGTASDYVKLTPSVDGLTLAPSYVASLSGVAWDSTYNGYYDVSGNLYVFDELKALLSGEISDTHIISGQFIQKMKLVTKVVPSSPSTPYSFAHGIAEAYSKKRIVNVTRVFYDAVSPDVADIMSTAGLTYDDTNIYVTNGTSYIGYTEYFYISYV